MLNIRVLLITFHSIYVQKLVLYQASIYLATCIKHTQRIDAFMSKKQSDSLKKKKKNKKGLQTTGKPNNKEQNENFRLNVSLLEAKQFEHNSIYKTKVEQFVGHYENDRNQNLSQSIPKYLGILQQLISSRGTYQCYSEQRVRESSGGGERSNERR